MIIRELISDIVEYDNTKGVLLWKARDENLKIRLQMTDAGVKIFNRRFAGKPILNKMNNGYIQVCMHHKNLGLFNELAHRVIWFLCKGYWPSIIDHIDGDKTNNLIENLRDVSQKENVFNAKLRADNTTGTRGVSYRKDRGTWRAYTNVEGKPKSLGHYETLDEAISARKAWEIGSGHIFRD